MTDGTLAAMSPGPFNPTYGFDQVKESDPSNITNYRVDPKIEHEVFLKTDQKEMQKIMNKEAHEKR